MFLSSLVEPLLIRVGLVAYARAVPPSSAGLQPRVASGQTAQAQGGGGCEDLCSRVQGGHTDNVDELVPHEGASHHRQHGVCIDMEPYSTLLKIYTLISRACATQIILAAEVRVLDGSVHV